jgi:hypothetical protein
VSAVLLALAIAGAIASSGAEALQGRQLLATRTAPAEPAHTSDSASGTTVDAPAGTLPDPTRDSVPEIAAPLAAAPSPNEPAVSSPIVSEGRTELGDGLFAVRDGRSVMVHFDVPQARTRRRDKFDRIVRATLPRIYGPVAQAALDGIPTGQIVAAGTLPTDLEKSGVRLPLGDSASIELWPELRDAHGGPLVVGYRVAVAR